MLKLRGSLRLHAWLRVIVLAGFCFALWAASGHHTDDGCQVELHCFACQWVLNGKVDLPLPIPEAPTPQVASHVRTAESPGPAEGVAPRFESRGPPTA
jgi:hypothetical protein